MEEMGKVLEEVAFAENEESPNPLEDFAFWLRDLSGCASLKGNLILESAGSYYGEISYNAWDPSDFEEGLAKSCHFIVEPVQKLIP